MRALSASALRAFVLIALALVVTPAVGQLAQEPLLPVEPVADPVAIQIGSGRLLHIETPEGALVEEPLVERIALADDTIARIQVISAREVLITGLEPGQTTLFVWLSDSRRLRYELRVAWDLDLLEKALWDLDPRIVIEVSANGRSIVLRGEVEDRDAAFRARQRAEDLVAGMISGEPGARVVDLLRYPGAIFSVEKELEKLLHETDERIVVRRIQVGEEPSIERDTFVLQGRVKNIQALTRAVILAERQLGGTGTSVSAGFEANRVASRRLRGYNGDDGARDGLTGLGGNRRTGAGDDLGLRGTGARDPTSSSLASQVGRGLLLTSASGRVVSLLKVDDLYQVMVSIRVLEVDRVKARKAGFNFRYDGEHLSLGSYLGPNVDRLPTTGSPPSVTPLTSNLGNFVGAFIDQTAAVVAAIDFLQEKNLARTMAEPNVLTLSGELATVSVGGEVPILTTTATAVTTFQGVFFQEFGVRLDLRPTVTDGDLVLLEVAPSITRPVAGLDGVPGFTLESVTTTAQVQAGQSLLIGGLIAFEEGVEDRRVPGLGVLPFFRWKRDRRQERELLFLITPRIVELEQETRADATVDPSPEPAELELPELEFEEGRRKWKDPFDPQLLPPDGIPESFRPKAEELEAEIYEVEPDIELEVDQVPTEADLGWRVGVEVEPCVELRPEAGVWSAPVDCIEPGTPVRLLGPARSPCEAAQAPDATCPEPWTRIELEDGRDGWVAGQSLERYQLGIPLPPTEGASEADEDEVEGAGTAAGDAGAVEAEEPDAATVEPPS